MTAANLAAAAAAASNKQLLDDKTADIGKPTLPNMGNIPGITGLSMQSMMDLTSTHHALLSLARSAAASNFPASMPTSNSMVSSPTASKSEGSEMGCSSKSTVCGPKKRTSSGTGRPTSECPLDLSGPQVLPYKRSRLSMESDNLVTDNNYTLTPGSDKQDSSLTTPGRPSLSIITNGIPSSLLAMQSNSKTGNQVQVDPTILNWSVEDVVDFVSSIDICKEYCEVRESIYAFVTLFIFIVTLFIASELSRYKLSKMHFCKV